VRLRGALIATHMTDMEAGTEAGTVHSIAAAVQRATGQLPPEEQRLALAWIQATLERARR
jgi:hypothetical protein